MWIRIELGAILAFLDPALIGPEPIHTLLLLRLFLQNLLFVTNGIPTVDPEPDLNFQNVRIGSVFYLGTKTNKYFGTDLPVPTVYTVLRYFGAMSICPRPMRPRHKFLGYLYCVPWTNRLLNIVSLTEPSPLS